MRQTAAMFFKLTRFAAQEDGAVTVDWIVLSAAIVGLGLQGVGTVQAGVNNLAQALGQGISTTSLDGGG